MAHHLTAWKPWLRPLPCTSSGRPKLRPDEVELRMLADVELMTDSDQVLHKGGVLVVTNQRIMYMTGVVPQDASDRQIANFYIDLRCVARISSDTPWFRWPRVWVHPGPINAAIMHPSQLNAIADEIHLPPPPELAQGQESKGFAVSQVKQYLPSGVFLSASGDYLPPQVNSSAVSASPVSPKTWGHIVFAIAKAADQQRFIDDARAALALLKPLCRLNTALEPYGGSTAPDAPRLLALPQAQASAEAKAPNEKMLAGREERGILPTEMGVGIAGILRKRELEQKKMDGELKEAFGDLTKLMDHAQRIVQLAERLAQKHSARIAGSVGGTQDGSTSTGPALLGAEIASSTEVSEDTVRELLSSMGITSPVTKASAGGLFHQQIALQLIDFLEKPIAVFGGVMTLTDVYSLYCRARGTALISPEDLLFAARRWEKMENCPLRLKTFTGTNTLVVCSADFDEDRLRRRVLEAIRTRQPKFTRGECNGMTAYELSKELRLSTYVINEILTHLENDDLAICRDVAPDGVYYYINFFMER